MDIKKSDALSERLEQELAEHDGCSSTASSDVSGSIESKLREATFHLIMGTTLALLDPRVRQFLYDQRYFDVAPSEILPSYFQKTETPNRYRQAIVLGCMDCLEEFRRRVISGTAFDDDGQNANFTYRAIRDLNLVVCSFTEFAPEMVALSLSPAAHTLLDLCISHETAKRLRGPVAELATILDMCLPWDAAQQRRWIKLIDQPTIPHYAFNHILDRDPHNPVIDETLPRLLIRKLEGTETFFISSLLNNFLKRRDNGEAAIARSIDRIPDELLSKLRAELNGRKSSRNWADLIAVRGETRAPLHSESPRAVG